LKSEKGKLSGEIEFYEDKLKEEMGDVCPLCGGEIDEGV